MNILERVISPTPKFFAKLRNISLVLVTLGATVLASPVALPAIVLQIAGYVTVAGTVGGAVSQVVTTKEGVNENEDTGGEQFP